MTIEFPESKPSENQRETLHLNEEVEGRIKANVELNGCLVNCIFDSGNTFRACGSPQLLEMLGLTKADLRPITHDKIGSAASGSLLTVIGETAEHVELRIPGLSIRFKFRIVILEQLDHCLNLGSKFMKAAQIQWNFAQDSLFFSSINKHLPLIDDDGRKNEFWKNKSIHQVRAREPVPIPVPGNIGQAVLLEDHMLQPGVPSLMSLRILDKNHKIPIGQSVIVEGILDGPKTLPKNHQVLPASNVVDQIRPNGQLFSQAINLGTLPKKLKKGTVFANVYEAVCPSRTTENIAVNRVQNDGTPLPGDTSNRKPNEPDLITPLSGKDLVTDEAHRQRNKPTIRIDELTKAEKDSMVREIYEKLELAKSPFCQEDPKIHGRLLNLLLKFYHVFSWDGSPGSTDLVQHCIECTDNLPVRDAWRPVAPPVDAFISKKVDDWLTQDIVEHSDSDFSNAIVCARKKGPEPLRLCIDYVSTKRAKKTPILAKI